MPYSVVTAQQACITEMVKTASSQPWSSLSQFKLSLLQCKSVCQVVYAIPLSHISDVREIAMELFRV